MCGIWILYAECIIIIIIIVVVVVVVVVVRSVFSGNLWPSLPTRMRDPFLPVVMFVINTHRPGIR